MSATIVQTIQMNLLAEKGIKLAMQNDFSKKL